MSIVPTPREHVFGQDGIARQIEGIGAAHALPMTDEQFAAAAKKRKRVPFGFQAPKKAKGKK